jgi:hypothetical protein
MTAALQMERLVVGWEGRHGALTHRSRRIVLVEYVDLHFTDGKMARLSRKQGEEQWTVDQDPDDKPPQFDHPDVLEHNPEINKPHIGMAPWGAA